MRDAHLPDAVHRALRSRPVRTVRRGARVQARRQDPLAGSPAFNFLTGEGGFLQVFTNGLTGLRWRSGRHRVLPPQAGAPHEELMSLVFFFELNHDALVTPLAPPIGRQADLPAVVSAPFLRERLDAITVG